MSFYIGDVVRLRSSNQSMVISGVSKGEDQVLEVTYYNPVSGLIVKATVPTVCVINVTSMPRQAALEDVPRSSMHPAPRDFMDRPISEL